LSKVYLFRVLYYNFGMSKAEYELYYWRRKGEEVDYVLHTPSATWAIEVKSSRMKNPLGMRRFLELFGR